jgi:hypothetical protein
MFHTRSVLTLQVQSGDHECAVDLHTGQSPLPVRMVLPPLGDRPREARCSIPDCPHPPAGCAIVRGWDKLCEGHLRVRWSWLSKGRQRLYLRRQRRRLRQAAAAARAERRALMRKLDGTDGRRRRSMRLPRSEEDARKRAKCAGSQNQSAPWKALGISRSTYFRRKLHGSPNAVTPGSADKTCLYRETLSEPNSFPVCTTTKVGGGLYGRGPMRSKAIRSVADGLRGQRLDAQSITGFPGRRSPHRFAGGAMQMDVQP